MEPRRLPELSVEPSVEWGADVAAAARQCSQGSELACYALGKPVSTSVRAYVSKAVRQYVGTSARQYVSTSVRQYVRASVRPSVRARVSE